MDLRGKTILLCNGAHLGDLILATSVLKPLKEAFPGCKIGFLIGSWALPVVQNHVLVDYIHFFDNPRLNRSSSSPKAKKRRGDATWHSAIQDIRNIGYDCAIDLYYFYKANSGKLIERAGIPKRFGFWASPAHYTFTDRLFWDHRNLHMVENHLECLKAIGVEAASLRPLLEYKDHVSPPLSKAKGYLLVHVGTGDPRRQWPLHFWKQLIRELRHYDQPLVLAGRGEKDRKMIQELSKECYCIDLCDKITWREFLPLVANARLLVGLESMAGHVAAVYNKPAVLIYGREANISCWRPYSSSCHVVSAPHPLPVKGKKPSRYAAIEKIQPEDVLAKITSLLR